MTAEGPHARKRPDDRLLDEAAEWIGRLRAPDVERPDRVAFARWLARSPAHRAAFDTMADLYDGLGVLARSPAVAPLSRERAPRPAGRPWLAAAAVLVLATGMLMLSGDWWGVDRIELRTARGETLARTLPDGSRLELNTDTDAIWTSDERTRQLRIELGGELFVDVAPDPARPFVVRTDHGIAEALGTAFAVHAGAARTRVTVVEGTVDVRPEAVADGAGRRVEAGRSVEITAGAPPGAVRAAEAQALGWREGRLVYDDVPLGELVEDLNRYLPRRMTISDTALASTRVSAVLTVSDQETMLRALSEVLPFGWVQINEQVLVIHPV